LVALNTSGALAFLVRLIRCRRLDGESMMLLLLLLLLLMLEEETLALDALEGCDCGCDCDC